MNRRISKYKGFKDCEDVESTFTIGNSINKSLEKSSKREEKQFINSISLVNSYANDGKYDVAIGLCRIILEDFERKVNVFKNRLCELEKKQSNLTKIKENENEISKQITSAEIQISNKTNESKSLTPINKLIDNHSTSQVNVSSNDDLDYSKISFQIESINFLKEANERLNEFSKSNIDDQIIRRYELDMIESSTRQNLVELLIDKNDSINSINKGLSIIMKYFTIVYCYEDAEQRDVIKLFKESLNLAKHIYGENNLEIANLCHCISNELFKMNNYQESEWFARQSLEIMKFAQKTDHYITAMDLILLASIYSKQDDDESIGDTCLRALVVLESARSNDQNDMSIRTIKKTIYEAKNILDSVINFDQIDEKSRKILEKLKISN